MSRTVWQRSCHTRECCKFAELATSRSLAFPITEDCAERLRIVSAARTALRCLASSSHGGNICPRHLTSDVTHRVANSPWLSDEMASFPTPRNLPIACRRLSTSATDVLSASALVRMTRSETASILTTSHYRLRLRPVATHASAPAAVACPGASVGSVEAQRGSYVTSTWRSRSGVPASANMRRPMLTRPSSRR